MYVFPLVKVSLHESRALKNEIFEARMHLSFEKNVCISLDGLTSFINVAGKQRENLKIYLKNKRSL